MYPNRLMCCAITELDGIQDNWGRFSPKRFLKSASTSYSFTEAAYYVFSTAGRQYTRGEKLAKYITDEKLGKVLKVGEPMPNPNTGRKVTMWVWIVDQEAWEKWRIANGGEKESVWN